MAPENIEDILFQAEHRYHLKIFENISEEVVARMPLCDRLRIVGQALIDRTDFNGFVTGRKLLAGSGLLAAAGQC